MSKIILSVSQGSFKCLLFVDVINVLDLKRYSQKKSVAINLVTNNQKSFGFWF